MKEPEKTRQYFEPLRKRFYLRPAVLSKFDSAI